MAAHGDAGSFDDDFDDDVFDNLPTSTLRQWESNIPFASQHAAKPPRPAGPPVSRSFHADPARPALSKIQQGSSLQRQDSNSSIQRGENEEVLINLDDYSDDRRTNYCHVETKVL